MLEINAIKTVFAHNGSIPITESVIAYDKNITPEQKALLRGLNFHEYPTIQELSADKGSEGNSDTQENSAKAQYSLQGNSMTEEEQRIVDEAKANGTFDASNPDIRFSLATDMARDAVMTALEGAGIDVEMATPEMMEDVLRARDGKLMNFANSKEEFNRRFELAERNFGIVAKGLNDAVLTIVKLDNHPFTGTLKEARRQAQTWANQNLQGKEFDMPNNGGKYKISKDAIKKYLDKSAIGESVNPFMHLSTLLKLTEVIANSVDAEIHPDYKKDSDNNRSPENGIKSNDMLVHRLYGAVELDGVTYRTKTTVYEYLNIGQDNSPHTYEVNEIELDDNPSAFPKIGVRKHSDVSTNSISVANLLKNVDKSYDKDKKLLKESERNPQFHIAYHGSGAKFDEFDHSHMGEGEGAQAYGWGTYLTEVEGIAKCYAKAYDTSQTLGERDWEQLNENIADTLSEEIGIELPIEVGWTGDGFEVFERVFRSNYDPNNVMKKEHYEALADYFNYDLDSYEGDYDEFWNEVEYDLIDVATKIAKRLEEEMETPKPMLYTVEIPDDNGSNYLDYDKEMSKKELNEVRNKLEAILAEGDYKGVEKELKRELDSVFVDGLTASDVYGNVSAYLGGDKQASEFFNEMGYVGIKYPANYRSGGNEDGKKNFVIFNDSDMTITDRVEFLQTPDGTVYGWTIGGKIFLTEQGMNAETPIHEYTHLWANAMRRNNEQGWESVKDLLRGTPMWDEVLADKNYSNIHDNEDLVASEVLSRYSGKDNAKRLKDEAQRMIGEAKGIGAKADAVSLIDRVRRALQKFWDWVGKDLFGIKDFDSIEQVTDRVLYDLMNQTDLNAEVSEGEANPIAEKEVVNVIVDSSEIKLPTNRAEALDVVSKMKRPFINHDQNKEIIVSNKAVRHAATQDKMHKFVDVRCLGVIDKIIENAVKIGNIDVAPDEIETTHKVEVYYCPVKIDDTQYSVRILVRQLKNKGRIMEDFRMYDLAAKDKKSDVSSQGTGNESLTPLLTSDFAYKVKDLIHNSKEQDKKLLGISNKTKFSLQGGRSIADKYEKRVNTKGKGGALHLSKFNAQEAFQDGELALKEVQRIIEQDYGIVLESYEDAYMAENAMSSIAKASWDRYINEVYEPMMRIHDEWIRSGESNESINHYLIAKSGLERNREFTVRDALAEMDKMDRQIINGAYSGTVLQLANALRQGQISQDEYNAQVQDAKDKKNQALENIKNAQQARVDAYRAERDALREQLKNGDITYEEFNQLSDGTELSDRVVLRR